MYRIVPAIAVFKKMNGILLNTWLLYTILYIVKYIKRINIMPFELPFSKKKDPVNPERRCNPDIGYVNLSIFSASELFAGGDPVKILAELTQVSQSCVSALQYNRLPVVSIKSLSEHSQYYLNLIDETLDRAYISTDDNQKGTWSMRFVLLQPILVNLVAAATELKNEQTPEHESKSGYSARFMG